MNGATVRAAVEFGNLELEVRKPFSELDFLETWKFEVGLTDSYKLKFENGIVGRPQQKTKAT